MKKTMEKGLLIVFAVLFVIASTAMAAAEKKSPTKVRKEAYATPTESATDWFHNPAEGLTMGADARFRWVYGRNIDSIKDEYSNRRENNWHFNRYRMRWWQKLMLSDDVSINSRLVWEMRTWDEGPSKEKDWNADEILFDRLNIEVKNFLDLPATLTIGRQDIILGKGWLVLDGTPLDGSRTICFDAIRLNWNFEDSDTVIDTIFIDQRAAQDAWLKPINDRDRYFTEQDEYGAIFYLTNKSIENTQLEAYFMYKNDNPVDVPSADEPNPWPSSVWSKKAEIYTFGGAIQSKLDKNWSLRAEGAMQTGKKEMPSRTRTADLESYGAVSRLTYHFHDEYQNCMHVGYEYLSGDDPDTRDNEAWDPMWGEWPQWSELYVYCYNLETMIGETTNLHRANIGHSFKPCPKWQVNTDYHMLWADENTGAWYGSLQQSSSSNFRGQLFTCWVKHQASKQLRWHWLTEYLIPGSFYDQSNREHALFFRFNIEYTF